MSGEPSNDDPLGWGQCRYTEYRVGTSTIAVIQDAEDDPAWIQSIVITSTDS